MKLTNPLKEAWCIMWNLGTNSPTSRFAYQNSVGYLSRGACLYLLLNRRYVACHKCVRQTLNRPLCYHYPSWFIIINIPQVMSTVPDSTIATGIDDDRKLEELGYIPSFKREFSNLATVRRNRFLQIFPGPSLLTKSIGTRSD